MVKIALTRIRAIETWLTRTEPLDPDVVVKIDPIAPATHTNPPSSLPLVHGPSGVSFELEHGISREHGPATLLWWKAWIYPRHP